MRTIFLFLLLLLFYTSSNQLLAQTCTITTTVNYPGTSASCTEAGTTTPATAQVIIIDSTGILNFDSPNEDWIGTSITVYGTLTTSAQTQDIVASDGILIDGGTFQWDGNATIGSVGIETNVTLQNGGKATLTGNSSEMYGDLILSGSNTSSQDNFTIGTNGELNIYGDVFVGTPGSSADENNTNAIINIEGRLEVFQTTGSTECDHALYVYGTVNATDAGSSDKIKICNKDIFKGGSAGCIDLGPNPSPQDYIDNYNPNVPFCLNSTFDGPLVFTDGPVVLPVELVNFEVGLVNGQYAECVWLTASETNNSHFEVERSLDGETFEAIGRVEGRGTTDLTSSYSFKDFEYQEGVNYYRLKQVDFDGKYAYSWVVALYIGERPDTDLLVYPNPSNLGYFNVNAGGVALENITLHDLTGRQATSWKAYDVVYNHQLSTTNLPKGNYIISIMAGGGQVIRQKVVVE